MLTQDTPYHLNMGENGGSVLPAAVSTTAPLILRTGGPSGVAQTPASAHQRTGSGFGLGLGLTDLASFPASLEWRMLGFDGDGLGGTRHAQHFASRPSVGPDQRAWDREPRSRPSHMFHVSTGSDACLDSVRSPSMGRHCGLDGRVSGWLSSGMGLDFDGESPRVVNAMRSGVGGFGLSLGGLGTGCSVNLDGIGISSPRKAWTGTGSELHGGMIMIPGAASAQAAASGLLMPANVGHQVTYHPNSSSALPAGGCGKSGLLAFSMQTPGLGLDQGLGKGFDPRLPTPAPATASASTMTMGSLSSSSSTSGRMGTSALLSMSIGHSREGAYGYGYAGDSAHRDVVLNPGLGQGKGRQAPARRSGRPIKRPRANLYEDEGEGQHEKEEDEEDGDEMGLQFSDRTAQSSGGSSGGTMGAVDGLHMLPVAPCTGPLGPVSQAVLALWQGTGSGKGTQALPCLHKPVNGRGKGKGKSGRGGGAKKEVEENDGEGETRVWKRGQGGQGQGQDWKGKLKKARRLSGSGARQGVKDRAQVQGAAAVRRSHSPYLAGLLGTLPTATTPILTSTASNPDRQLPSAIGSLGKAGAGQHTVTPIPCVSSPALATAPASVPAPMLDLSRPAPQPARGLEHTGEEAGHSSEGEAEAPDVRAVRGRACRGTGTSSEEEEEEVDSAARGQAYILDTPASFHAGVEQCPFDFTAYGIDDLKPMNSSPSTDQSDGGLKGCFVLLELSMGIPLAQVHRRIGGYTVQVSAAENGSRHSSGPAISGTRCRRLTYWFTRRVGRNWSKEAMVRYPHRAGVVARRMREQGRFS